MNFIKKLFKKDSSENFSEIIDSFLDTYIELENVFILTDSRLKYKKDKIREAFDKQIKLDKSLIKSLDNSTPLKRKMEERLNQAMSLKVHIEDFIEIPPRFVPKVEEANRIFEKYYKQTQDRQTAIRKMPIWAMKISIASHGGHWDEVEDLLE